MICRQSIKIQLLFALFYLTINHCFSKFGGSQVLYVVWLLLIIMPTVWVEACWQVSHTLKWARSELFFSYFLYLEHYLGTVVTSQTCQTRQLKTLQNGKSSIIPDWWWLIDNSFPYISLTLFSCIIGNVSCAAKRIYTDDDN